MQARCSSDAGTVFERWASLEHRIFSLENQALFDFAVFARTFLELF